MVQRRKQNPGKLLDHLLNSDLSENAVCDELDNLLIAGFDTTSTVLSFIIYKLSTNPEIQDIAYQEILVNDYNNQQFLESIIKEGLRLYPGVPKLHRTITKDIQCGNVKFSKGTEVSINIFDIHRDEKYFPNPEKFY
uniref:Cytochrome P450 n=1 Tax=Megaselia scalaris TaxID=36166 RepID=T1GZ05_MEGSC